MIKKFIAYILIILFIYSCNGNNKNNEYEKTRVDQNPEEIYLNAKEEFDNKNFEVAKEQFREIIKLFPLSNEAIEAQVMLGFMSYMIMDYEDAILQFNRIISKYPSLKNLDYVYYMVAICNYEQITHHGLDGMYNELALESFIQVINRFPLSKYAQDSRQKIILVKSNKAAKHMEIGRFYLKDKKFNAALNRFKIVIEEYSMTKFPPEALHRMVEIYFHLGMKDDAIKTASVLGYNYPNSKWYSHSYNLIKKNQEDETILKKLINSFS